MRWLLLLLLAAPASAADLYVSPAGSGTACTQGSPCALATANAARHGSVIHMADGTYATGINPDSSSTYIGNQADTAAVTVQSIVIDRPNVTVRWVRSLGGCDFQPTPGASLMAGDYGYAYRDSLVQCAIRSHLMLHGAKDCVVVGNKISADNTTVRVGSNLSDCRGITSCNLKDPGLALNSERDTLRGNVIDFGTCYTGRQGMMMSAFASGCVIDSNHVSGNFSTAGGTTGEMPTMLWLENSRLATFRDNHWTFHGVTVGPKGSNWNALYIRDSTYSVTFERDTLDLSRSDLEFPFTITMSSEGSSSNCPPIGTSLHDNRMIDCVVRGSVDVEFQDECHGYDLSGNVFAITGNFIAPTVGPEVMTDFTFRHNTVVNLNGKSAVNITFKHAGAPVPWLSSTLMKSNIFGVRDTSAVVGNDKWSTVFADDSERSLLGYSARDSNLFFRMDGHPTMTMWSRNQNDCALATYAADTHHEVHSRYGLPLFVNATSNYGDTLDLTPATFLSAAISSYWPDGYVGAVPKLSAPLAVNDLTVSDCLTDSHQRASVTLTFTAPYDSVFGNATAYDVRRANFAIDASNFDTATPMLSGVPETPAAANVGETFTLTGLGASTEYWIALKARNSAGRWSAISNVVDHTTGARNTVCP